MNDSTYITHEDPVARGANNYLAMVDLRPFGFEGAYEQVWLSALADGKYEVDVLERKRHLCLT
ncbi:hypothetical protein [Streptomyces sp. NPDC096152]|uniref:hypothetical protein n=1 Tax=Streptomyces sp. NPDC096152 TaxID=3366078 RepID=UPI00381BC85C